MTVGQLQPVGKHHQHADMQSMHSRPKVVPGHMCREAKGQDCKHHGFQEAAPRVTHQRTSVRLSMRKHTRLERHPLPNVVFQLHVFMTGYLKPGLF